MEDYYKAIRFGKIHPLASRKCYKVHFLLYLSYLNSNLWIPIQKLWVASVSSILIYSCLPIPACEKTYIFIHFLICEKKVISFVQHRDDLEKLKAPLEETSRSVNAVLNRTTVCWLKNVCAVLSTSHRLFTCHKEKKWVELTRWFSLEWKAAALPGSTLDDCDCFSIFNSPVKEQLWVGGVVTQSVIPPAGLNCWAQPFHWPFSMERKQGKRRQTLKFGESRMSEKGLSDTHLTTRLPGAHGDLLSSSTLRCQWSHNIYFFFF